MSVIKIGNLKDNLKINDNKINLSGVGGTISTLGTIEINIVLKNKRVSHLFHVIKDDCSFKYPAVLGRDFMTAKQAKIDFGTNSLEIEGEILNLDYPRRANDVLVKEIRIIAEEVENSADSTQGQMLVGNSSLNKSSENFDELASKAIIQDKNDSPTDTHIHENMENQMNFKLKPRSIQIIEIKINMEGEGLIEGRELEEGIYLGNSLVKSKGNKCYVSILNTTEKSAKINLPELKITPVEINENNGIYSMFISGIVKRQKDLKNSLNLEHLNAEEKENLLELINDFHDTFHLNGDKLTTVSPKEVTHEIITPENQRPINIRQYRIAHADKDVLRKIMEEQIRNGTVRTSKSPWNAPLILVKKKGPDGEITYRMCLDYRLLNSVTLGDSYPLPLISDILDQLGNAKYFSTLDLKSGYHQIQLREEDKAKTAFSTDKGHFEYNSTPFGLKNMPMTFQRWMNNALTGLNGISTMVYMDDIVCYSKDLDSHMKHLKEIFIRLRRFNLKLSPQKCEFLRREVIYLGHKISQEGVTADPGKVSVLRNFPIPKDQKEIKSFMGLASYYRKFIKNFSKIAYPINRLLRKDTPFLWEQEQQNSFEILKEKLTTAPVLAYPDFSKPFEITTDASGTGLGCVLSQGDRPIAYASRAVSRTESKYPATHLECLAVVFAVNHFRPYLIGRKFTIYTDARSLIWLFSLKDPASQLYRWRLKLSEFDYEIKYKPGTLNRVADCLSRINVLQRANDESRSKNESLTEAELTEEEPEGENENFTETEPTEEEKIIIFKELHDGPFGGHMGITKTIKRIKRYFYWKTLERDVKEYIQKCQICQKMKRGYIVKPPLQITNTPEQPFDTISCDVVGPLTLTERSNIHVLTVQDHFTKFLQAFAMPDQRAETIAEILTNKVFCKFGIPGTILTDQGKPFLSNLMKDVLKLLKISRINTSPYHPQTNGMLERSHAPLATYLRCYINESQTDWDLFLDQACFVYNTTPHMSTQFQPHELLFGRSARLPGNLLKGQISPAYSYDDYVQSLRRNFRILGRIAKTNLIDKKMKAKKIFDRKSKEILYEVGEKILLKHEHRYPGRSKKLDSVYRGPFVITEIISYQYNSFHPRNPGREGRIKS